MWERGGKGTKYELRKQYGSAVYTQHGKEAAAGQLGHASSTVREGYYATWTSLVPTVTLEALRGEAVPGGCGGDWSEATGGAAAAAVRGW